MKIKNYQEFAADLNSFVELFLLSMSSASITISANNKYITYSKDQLALKSTTDYTLDDILDTNPNAVKVTVMRGAVRVTYLFNITLDDK